MLKILSKSTETRFEVVLEEFVSIMGTLFTEPEQSVVVQGEKANALYFISSGSCQVSQISHYRQEKVHRKLLSFGDHFGEIGCLYNCNRTCTVTPIDYNILARISKARLRMLISDYPKLLTEFQKHVHSYKDSTKVLLNNAMRRIKYFEGLDVTLQHKIIYMFKEFVA